MEETVERVNPMDLDPSVSCPFDPARSEHVSTKALLKIYHNKARVLDRLTTDSCLIQVGVRNQQHL